MRAGPDGKVPKKALIEDVGLIEIGRRIVAPLIDVVKQAIWIVARLAGKSESLAIGVGIGYREAASELVI